MWIMKYRILASMLVLTVVSWAQTATQNAPQGQSPAEKASCCVKMAGSDAKGGHASCPRHAMHHDGQASEDKETASCCAGKASKDAMSCCAGKDAAKSCMKGGDKEAMSCGNCCSKEKDKAAGACCGDKCGMNGKGCCSAEEKSAETPGN